jgi:Fanconi anemia group M protein
VSTPQGLENDIISRRIKFEEVSLLIFDEAHRAVGDYAYVFLAGNYVKTSKFPRILALTASPGSDIETILDVCNNLFIDNVEFRSADDSEVSPYVQDMNVEYVKVELSDELKKIKAFLERCYSSKLEEASTLGYMSGGAANYTRSSLLSAVSGLHSKIAQGDKSFELLKTISLIAEALKVQHALELIETQGTYQLVEYLNELEKQRFQATQSCKKSRQGY